MEYLAKVLQAYQELLSPDNVVVDQKSISAAETATFATTQKVLAIIRPGNCAEVQECVCIANKYKVPIYPVSTGKNWGYGSKVPTQDGCVIMELSRLNRIVDYDEKLAYVTVEAGVTQGQLFEFLQKHQSNLMMSVTGSASDSSLVGNILERGIGKGPYGDRFANVCGFEVVLPTGELIHTGFDRFANAQAAKVNRWGIGPYLDGIFTQSNFGIVTQMTIWLIPQPQYFQSFFYSLQDDSAFEEFIDTLQNLKLQGLLRNSFVIFNDYRMLSTKQQYPWKDTNEKTPLPEDLMPNFRKAWGGGLWIGEGALYSASKEQGRIERKLIQRALKKTVNKIVFFDERKAKILEIIRPIYKLITGVDLRGIIDFFYNKNLQRGIPTDKVISMAYWRKRDPVPSNMNPDRDRCGLIWLAPSVPFDGKHVRTALKIIEEIAIRYQFEPNIGLQCVTERSIDMTVAIVYDRDVPGEDERAIACHDEMMQKLILEGYIPYRLTTSAMNSLPTPKDDYGKLLQELKRALDPNNILAPGRYDFQQDWPDKFDFRKYYDHSVALASQTLRKSSEEIAQD
ncbi:FAD-binding oxidoreductase [Nostoc sp. FACHB-190]|uniref:FAD-binding oxidoreductase n=1 Tax=Nostoc sp. FACHB-190 TaxID=2692838 RepID=UPI0016868FED|nr:FAD-binding oxidoreductase [Nostoc sp. FACHB-190]MBD2300152.1 FAD-binding oxidoreductase [Nostoc sp. FACHB-190]